jgi:outer membrane lipoprotein LolB
VNYTRDREEQMESLHGKFTWQQAGEKTRIRFFSPLGQSVAAIDVTSEKAVFTASGKQPVAAPDADALTFRQLGWPLPVSGMRNWLQGCATDAAGQVFKASSARPEVTTRDGWRIHYLDWSAFGESERVPRRVDMTHTPAAPAAVSSINIRLVIDEWHTENEDAF